MKKVILFLSVSAISVVLISCDNSTEPKEPQRLVIENGFYSKVASSTPNEIKYKVEFVYYVKGEACEWGGYKIETEYMSSSIVLAQKKKLLPDEKHTVVDSIKVFAELTKDPVLSMQGYKVGSSEATEALKVEYTLKPKL